MSSSFWSQEEINILSKSDPHSTAPELQKKLHKAGFVRTAEAVKRKLRRLFEEERLTKQWKEVSEQAVYQNNKNCVLKPVFVEGSLPLNESDTTKFVQFNDVHVPYNIPLDNIFEFIKDYQPDYILLVGDIINNDPFSHWDKKSPLRFKRLPQPKEYYEQCNELFYRPLKKIIPKTCKIVHWIGNHEHWTQRAIEEMPEGEGYWEVWNNIEHVDMWVKHNGVGNLGHLHFLHGDIIRGGKHHSTAMMNYFRRNIRYGHYHDLQEASHTSPIDNEDRHTARSCGTLQQFNPHFMANRPHDWAHCISYGLVEPNGNFYDHTAVITDGKFMANGKVYG